MRILLDTHAFLWWMEGNPRLVTTARRAVAAEENDILVSAASACEITTKHRLGRLPEADKLAGDIRGAIASQDFAELPVSVPDAERAGRLTGPVQDPFDRMLIGQALSYELALVSNEKAFDWYRIRRLW